MNEEDLNVGVFPVPPADDDISEASEPFLAPVKMPMVPPAPTAEAQATFAPVYDDAPEDPTRLTTKQAAQIAASLPDNETMLKQSRTPDQITLDSAMEVLRDTPAEYQAKALKLQRVLGPGVPLDFIKHNYDLWAQTAKNANYDSRTLERDYPEMAGMLIREPELVPLVKEDTPLKVALDAIRRAVPDYSTGFGEGSFMSEDEAQIVRDQFNKEKAAKIALYEKRIKEDGSFLWARDMSDANPWDTNFGPQGRFTKAFQATDIATEQGKIGWINMRRRLAMERGDEEAVKQYDRELYAQEEKITQMQLANPPVNYGSGVATDILNATAQLAPSEWATFKGLGAGYGLAATAGVISSIATRNPAAFASTTGAAARFLIPATAFATTFDMEFNGAYAEFAAQKLDSGRTVDEADAFAMSIGYAMVSAAIEISLLPYDLGAMGFLGSFARGPERREAFKAWTAKNPHLWERIRGNITPMIKSWAAESGEEGSQQFAQGIFKNLTNLASAHGEVQTIDWRKDFWEDPWESTWQAAKGMPLLIGGKGALGGMFTQGYVWRQSRLREAQNSELAERAAESLAAKAGDQKAQQTVAILEGLQGSETLKAAPHQVAKTIVEATERTGTKVENLYLPVEELLVLHQDDHEAAKDTAKALLGETGPAQVDAALAGENDGRIAIPMEAVAEKLIGTPLAEKVADHLAAGVNEPTPAQRSRNFVKIMQQAEEIAKQAEADPEDPVTQRLNTLHGALTTEARGKELGNADAIIKLVRSSIYQLSKLRSDAEKREVTPLEVASEIIPQVLWQQKMPAAAHTATKDVQHQSDPTSLFRSVAARNIDTGKVTELDAEIFDYARLDDKLDEELEKENEKLPEGVEKKVRLALDPKRWVQGYVDHDGKFYPNSEANKMGQRWGAPINRSTYFQTLTKLRSSDPSVVVNQVVALSQRLLAMGVRVVFDEDLHTGTWTPMFELRQHDSSDSYDTRTPLKRTLEKLLDSPYTFVAGSQDMTAIRAMMTAVDDIYRNSDFHNMDAGEAIPLDVQPQIRELLDLFESWGVMVVLPGTIMPDGRIATTTLYASQKDMQLLADEELSKTDPVAVKAVRAQYIEKLYDASKAWSWLRLKLDNSYNNKAWDFEFKQTLVKMERLLKVGVTNEWHPAYDWKARLGQELEQYEYENIEIKLANGHALTDFFPNPHEWSSKYAAQISEHYLTRYARYVSAPRAVVYAAIADVAVLLEEARDIRDRIANRGKVPFELNEEWAARVGDKNELVYFNRLLESLDKSLQLLGHMQGTMLGMLNTSHAAAMAPTIKRKKTSRTFRRDYQTSMQKYLRNLMKNSNFVKWWRDSAVRDSEGLPLLAFHATAYHVREDERGNLTDEEIIEQENFREFRISDNDIGVHAGTPEAARDRVFGQVTPITQATRDAGLGSALTEAFRKKARVYPVMLSIRNPLVLSDLLGWDADSVLQRAYTHEGVLTRQEYVRALGMLQLAKSRNQENRIVVDTLKMKGFDGVVYRNTAEDVDSTSYIVFDASQIKSPFNTGTFSLRIDDILYQDAAAETLLQSLNEIDGLQEQKGDKSGSRGARQVIRDAGKRAFKVFLNSKKADRSTFVHEMGHIFLDQLMAYADGAANDSVLYGMGSATLSWLGVTKWSEIKTEHHEKFAKGFEKYLMEGKAPSAKLMGVFAQFKVWLLDVYKKMRGYFKDVDLDPSIREVFDRLLASDMEIKRHRAWQNRVPLMTSPAKMGITAEEYVDQLDSLELMYETATFATQQRALKEAEGALSSWYRGEIERLLNEKVEEREGVDLSAADIALYQAHPELWGVVAMNAYAQDGGYRFKRSVISRLIGKAGADQFTEWGWVAKGEEAKELEEKELILHPDDVAPEAGFKSGKEWLRAVLDGPEFDEWKQKWAEDQMRAKHPDILSDVVQLKQAVADAHHNEYTEEWLHKQLLAYKQKMTPEMKKAGIITDAMSIRMAAELLVGDRKLSDLETAKIQSAERTAAQRSLEAAVEGNYALAAIYKQKQLLNYYMYKQAERARKVGVELNRVLRRARTKDARSNLTSVSRGYGGFVDQVMEMLGVRKPNIDTTEVEGRPTVEMLVQEINTADLTPEAFDPAMLTDILASGVQDIQELTLNQANTLLRAVKQVIGLANKRGKVQVQQELEKVDDFVARVAAENAVQPNLPGKPVTLKGKQKRKTREDVRMEKTDPALFFKWLGPTARKFFWWQHKDAEKRENELHGRILERLWEHWKTMPAEVRARRAELLDDRLPMPKSLPTYDQQQDRMWMWMVILNSGNSSNLARLLGSYEWTEQQLREWIARNATAEELDFLQGLLDLFEAELYPEVAKTYEQQTSIRPQKIAPLPYTYKLASGEEVTFKGGYFPVKHDTTTQKVLVAEALQGDEATGLNRPYYNPSTKQWEPASVLRGGAKRFTDRPSVELNPEGGLVSYMGADSAADVIKNSFVHERNTKGQNAKTPDEAAQGHKEKIILLDFNVIPSHVLDVVHYIAYNNFIQNADKVVSHTGFRTLVQQKLGYEAMNQIDHWLLTAAAGKAVSANEAIRANFRKLAMWRAKMIISTIGGALNVVTGDAITILSATSTGKVPMKYMFDKYMLMVAGFMTFGYAPYKVQQRWRNEGNENLSAVLKPRRERYRHRIAQELGEISEAASDPWDMNLKRKVVEASWWIFDYVDQIVSGLVWQASFEHARDNLPEGADIMEAARHADSVIEELLPNHSIMDMPSLLRDRATFTQLIAFFSFFSKQYNQYLDRRMEVRRAYHGTEGSRTEKTLAASGTAFRAGAQWMATMFVTNVLGEMFSGRGKEPDEEYYQWLARKMLAAPFLMYPIGGPIAEFTAATVITGKMKKFSVRANPAAAAFQKLMMEAATGYKMATGKKELTLEDSWAVTMGVIGVLGGLPTVQLSRTGKYVLSGKWTDDSPFGVMQGVWYGDKPKRRQGETPLTLADKLLED